MPDSPASTPHFACPVVGIGTASSTPTGVAVTFDDINGHKRAAEESCLYVTIIRDSNDAIAVYNLDGRILVWNHGAERMYGLTAPEAMGRNIEQLIPESRRKDALSVLERLARGEIVASYEGQRVTRDGRILDVWITATALLDTSGTPIAVAQTDRDITDRKQAEQKLRAAYADIGLQYEERGTQLAHAIETINVELANRTRVEQALRESQDRLKVIFNTAAEGIITINQLGIIDSFNPAAERIFGYSAKEVIGRNVSMLMPPAFRDRHGDYLADYMKTGHKHIIGTGREVSGLRKDGTTFPMDLNVGEGMDGAGPIFTGIVRDLTRRKEEENRLRTAERLATIGTLAAGLGHDMNNVLLPVRAHLNAAQAAADPKVQRCVKQIGKSVDYLQQLADGLHFLAADPEGGEVGGPGERTDLATWWSQTGALLSKPVPRHVRVVSSIPTVKKGRAGKNSGIRLPEVAIATHRLTQAVLNLIVNAGQAIPPPSARAGRKGLIRISAEAINSGNGRSSRNVVQLRVQDNGTGMSEEVRRHAFDMFFTTKTRGLGTGLGLPLVDRIVRNAGGWVEIESKVGRGTTVILNLPAAPSPAGTGSNAGARSAVITMTDLRTAKLVGKLIEAARVRVQGDQGLPQADLWVVEPKLVSVAKARAWLARRAKAPRSAGRGDDRKLVVVGPLGASELKTWGRLGPIIIEQPDDFVSLRDAVGRALSQQ